MVHLLFSLLSYLIYHLSEKNAYHLADFTAFVLQKIIRYRTGIVKENLSHCFPSLDDTEIAEISTRYYQHLADLFIESFRVGRLHSGNIDEKYGQTGVPAMKEKLAAGQSVIFATAHFGNWEWGAAGCPYHLRPYPCVVFYKPIKNKKIESRIIARRESQGCEIISIAHTAATFEKYKDRPTVYFMLADQSPSNLSKSLWVDFFNRPTAALHGVEHYARCYGLAVFFGAVFQKENRGIYHIAITKITDNGTKNAPGEITQNFFYKLEEAIRIQPHNWLWTHKRWKHNPM